jgi:uncharacterized protein
MTDSLLSPPEPPALDSLFRGNGLPFVFVRVCVYLILGDAVTYGLTWVARFFLAPESAAFSPRFLLTHEFIALAGSFSAAYVLSRLERRSFDAYGLPLANAFGKFFWHGALFGLIEISSVIGALKLLGYYRFGFMELHGGQLASWALFWLLLFLLVGFYEEFAFRGYVQFTISQGIGFWPAAILLSVMFGWVHTGTGNYGETWQGIVGVVLTGLLWCFTLRRTGTLWFAVGMHASFDFGETFLYSAPDSGVVFPGHLSSASINGPTWLTGGTAGPEASVLDFIVLISFFFVFHFLYWRPVENKPSADAPPV